MRKRSKPCNQAVRRSGAGGGLFAAIITACAVFAVTACGGRGPTDLATLKKIVASQTPKEEMDIVHRTHERAGADCYQCHHKWENPDRIRNCTNCHRGKEEEIARGICVKCHETGMKKQ